MSLTRRDFVKGAALGLGIGTLGAMGVYSYSPMRFSMLPKSERKMQDIGVCKSVRITNISETSWFDNSIS